MYFVSVDCGGSKSAFALTDEKGVELARCKLGPGNHLILGIDKTVELINAGIDELCNQAKIDKHDITMTILATAGYGSSFQDKMYDEAAKNNYDFNYIITGDTKNALKGSLLDNPGIHIIAGTGSICKGFNGKEKCKSVGGWGYYADADEGSGHWIGCSLLRHFEWQADGREEKTLLYDYMYKTYDFKCDNDCLYLVMNRLNNQRDKIAALARDVANLCELNDSAALQIMYDAGVQLGTLARALYKNNEFEDPVTITYSGSVFKSLKYLKPGIEKALEDVPHVLADPILGPLAGGIALAMEMANYKYDDEVVENLKKIKD